MTESTKTKEGLASAFAAYVAWGLLPLYWHLLRDTEALQIMAGRVVFALVFLWIVLAARKRADWPKALADRKTLLRVVPASILIAANWGLYIWAVNSSHAVEASLGYYLNPLVNVFLGLVFFRERMDKGQWAAFALAAVGVALLVADMGSVPWIALALALSFGLYGMAKKKSALEPLEGLASETLVLFPAAIAFLFWRHADGSGAFAAGSATAGLIAASGVVTALPLIWFAQGAKKLPLSVMGFIQFLSPTLQLLIAVFAFGEPFPLTRLPGFALIWLALLVYAFSRAKRNRMEEPAGK